MAANPRDILLRPLITEKTSAMMQDNKYTFQVALGANNCVCQLLLNIQSDKKSVLKSSPLVN